ncbi:hypothetical protein AUC71_08100 [Methyloceanibacter marginalis]|uniref:Uncharacterized protein n=1 Tax=Methyloceanibacter marginalis TaxID=1774971 RepID=A0A1E3WD37_9HYPH|nr:hypothetical protein [Methyloceanibacter marginalis]ODS03725.1 hypothetical protein AUC71_08100 [Methyloceanibacter marginalis]
MRKGASSGSVFGSTCSKYSSSVGPEYQGISAERATTLAPVSAATGIAVISVKPKLPASARKSASMAR